MSMFSYVVGKKNKYEFEFPKLMLGRKTGTIYLARASLADGKEVQTVVLVPAADSAQKIGEMAVYLKELLEDFNGEIIMSNGK